MNYLGGLLKSVDYSSVNYYFHIDGGESFRTKFGGFLYICYFLFFMSFSIKLSIEFFLKTNYNVIPINKILPSPPELPLLHYNLSFAFSLTFDNNTIIPEEIMKKYIIEKAYFVSLLNSTKKIKREIKLRSCQKNDLYTKFNDPDLNYSDLINLRCLDDRNLSLLGGFNDQVFQYIEYGIYLNYTSFINEKMSFINNFYGNNLIKVVLKYFEMGIDVDNYSNPLKTYEFNIFKYLCLSKINKVNLDFSLYELQNNDQALFGNPDSTFFLKLGENFGYDYDMFERNPSVTDYNLLLKYYVRSSPNISIVNRTYQKLWDLLANIAGLAGQVLFCIVIINTYYNKFKSKEVLVNNLLKFKENYNISKQKLNELMKLQDEYINIIEIEKLQNQNFNRGSTARTFKSRSNYENLSGFHEINRFEFNDEQQLFINNSEKINEKKLNENIIRNKRLSYAKNIYQNEIYGELEKSTINKNYSDNNEINVDKNNSGAGSSNGIEKLLWIKRLSSAPNKNSDSFKLRKFNSNRQSQRAQNLNINKKGERAKTQKRSVGFVDGNHNKFNLPNFEDNQDFDVENEEDSKPRILKVDTLDSYFSAPQNKEKSNLPKENLNLDPNNETEAPKVVFMNKNLNVLRNSIFNNSSRLIIRKLLSAKNDEKLSNVLIKEENTNENISSRYYGERPEEDSINKKEIKNNSNQRNCSSENRVKTEENIRTGNRQALRNSKYENVEINQSNIDSFNSLSVDDENNEQRAQSNVLNQLTTRTNYNQYNNNMININNNNEINHNQIELMNFQKFKDISNKKFSFNALDKLIIDSAKVDKEIEKKNEEFELIDEVRKLNELTLKENKFPFKKSDEKDSNDLDLDENKVTIKIFDKEEKEINKAYINPINNNIIDKSDNIYYKRNDNMIDKNLNDLKKQKEGVKLSNIEKKKYSNKLSILKPNEFNNNININQNAEISPETFNQDDRNNNNLDLHSERHDLTNINKLNLNSKTDSQIKNTKKFQNSKFKDNKFLKKVFFKFSIFDIFCQCFCKLCKSKANQYQLYKRSYKSINNYLNIYYY